MPTELRGTAELRDYVGEISQRLSTANYEPLLRTLHQYLEQEHALFFGARIGPDGQPWKPNAESTIKRKGHDHVLIDDGDLAQTLSGPGHPDAIREIVSEGDNRGLSFGTRRPYSIFNQQGTSRIPQRLHVGANQKMVDAMSEMLLAFAIGVLVRGDVSASF